MNITHERLKEIVDTCDSVETGSWRWGKVNYYVFEQDGKNFMVSARFHVEEGLQDEGDAFATEVKPVERTITDWVKV